MYQQVFSRQFSNWANLKWSQKIPDLTLILGFLFLLMLINDGFSVTQSFGLIRGHSFYEKKIQQQETLSWAIEMIGLF